MKSTDFCYWLQGYFELSKVIEIGPAQTTMIKNHLNLVFKHEIDPSYGNIHDQAVLNILHSPPKFSGDNSGRDELVRC